MTKLGARLRGLARALIPLLDQAQAASGRPVADRIRAHAAMYAHEDAVDGRRDRYTSQVSSFYDLVTDFYEYGWGRSFHFATLASGERLDQALVRYEHYAVHRLGVDDGILLDVGSGVGGPAINVARLLPRVRIVGININAYQLEKARRYAEQVGLTRRIGFVRADFMNTGFANEAFDGAYAIESLPQAPDRVAACRELWRVLKPGAALAGYDWCTTGLYDDGNPEHRRVRYGIERGNCLPIPLASTAEVPRALRAAGFEVVDAFDMAAESAIPWQSALKTGFRTLRGLRMSAPGRRVTHGLVVLLEKLRAAPVGSTEVSRLLRVAADSVARGGDLGIFTPMFFFLARKPAR